MSNKRLEKLLLNRGMELQDGDFLDCYNQTAFSNIAPTITSRINASNHYYVAVIEDSPSNETGLH